MPRFTCNVPAITWRCRAISTDNLLETNEFRAGVGAHWTFLSDPGRKVQKDGYWFFARPTVEELRLDLRAVLQRCRPDWSISSAEQRAAWEKGDKTNFFPYGKTHAQTLAEQD